MRALVWFGLLVSAVTPTARAAESRHNNAFVEGYASAVLDRELGQPHVLFGVRDGVAYLDERAVDEGRARESAEAALRNVDGVESVRWVDAADEVPPAVSDPGPGNSDVAAEPRAGVVFLPGHSVFEPLLADPLWPRFSASYLEYDEDPELESVGSATMGGHIPLVGGELPRGSWELGVQAGVFSIFDLDADSLDLVNSDYTVALPVAVRFGWLSLMARGFHQSSHLGDEFLLRTGAERVNLDLEGLDGLASIDLWSWGRLYGGYGYLVNREPSDIQPRYVQAGVELSSPRALWGVLRPVAGLDVHRREEHEWRSDYSVRAGFQIESSRWSGRQLQILAEYYDGSSPSGQFFERRVEYWGVGIHVYP